MNDKKDDITLTLIFQMFEVINRCIDLNIDTPAVKMLVGRDFDILVQNSRQLSERYSRFIELDKRFENPNEVFEQDTDKLYNLILATKGLKKGWQWKKAIKEIKNISK